MLLFVAFLVSLVLLLEIDISNTSDYADTHKNKDWQRYAGGIAAAFTKELLLTLAPESVSKAPRKSKEIEAGMLN